MDSQEMISLVEEMNVEHYEKSEEFAKKTFGEDSRWDDSYSSPFCYLTNSYFDVINFFDKTVFCSEEFWYDPEEDHKGMTEREAILLYIKKEMKDLANFAVVAVDAISEMCNNISR